MIREGKGAPSSSGVQTLPRHAVGGRGCFIGILSAGRGWGPRVWGGVGWGAGAGAGAVQGSRSQRRGQCLCAQPADADAAILNCSVARGASAHVRELWCWALRFCPRSSGVKGRLRGLCTRPPLSKSNQTKHQEKEKRLGFILLSKLFLLPGNG